MYILKIVHDCNIWFYSLDFVIFKYFIYSSNKMCYTLKNIKITSITPNLNNNTIYCNTYFYCDLNVIRTVRSYKAVHLLFLRSTWVGACAAATVVPSCCYITHHIHFSLFHLVAILFTRCRFNYFFLFKLKHYTV